MGEIGNRLPGEVRAYGVEDRQILPEEVAEQNLVPLRVPGLKQIRPEPRKAHWSVDVSWNTPDTKYFTRSFFLIVWIWVVYLYIYNT